MNKQEKRERERRPQKIAEAIDCVTATDRDFFEQNPDRKHRRRPACQAEIEEYEIIVGGHPILPEHYWMFIVVRCFAPGVRIRMRAFMPVTNVRPSEEFAAAVFDLAIFQSDKLKKFAAKVAELKLTDR